MYFIEAIKIDLGCFGASKYCFRSYIENTIKEIEKKYYKIKNKNKNYNVFLYIFIVSSVCER